MSSQASNRFSAAKGKDWHHVLRWRVRWLLAVLICAVGLGQCQCQVNGTAADSNGASTELPSHGCVEQMIREYSADLRSVDHRYRVVMDEDGYRIRCQLQEQWLEKLMSCKFPALNGPSKIDYLLLQSKLRYSRQKLDRDHLRDTQIAKLWLPFSGSLVSFLKNREEVISIEPEGLAGRLDLVAGQIEELSARAFESSDFSVEQRIEGVRATELLRSLRSAIDEADRFYHGYDPLYNWWCRKPMERLRYALAEYQTQLQEKLVGIPESDQETIIGLPLGADGLSLELEKEWIAHSPEELIQLALREMSWCESQMDQAAAEMGFPGDWQAALNVVKSKYVPPGNQPEMIRSMALEAIEFLEDRQLVTIPPLAASGWRMTMMSPERQRVSPYFLGGDTIIVSFPTDEMTHQEKLMSLRSNNEHFARATVHHELIPGHHLQYHMLARHRTYRQIFATPFWMEGWALHWEMLLWDLDFARGPEDRIGMLFWRKHRCARIIFSLQYHLGLMTPQECIDYLVQKVGHERAAAAAEVRRSIMGGYGPLYQAAYMIGGLQLRKLHEELVASGKMSDREFHDAVLKEHSIPIELLRAYLVGQPLDSQSQPAWRFADP